MKVETFENIQTKCNNLCVKGIKSTKIDHSGMLMISQYQDAHVCFINHQKVRR